MAHMGVGKASSGSGGWKFCTTRSLRTPMTEDHSIKPGRCRIETNTETTKMIRLKKKSQMKEWKKLTEKD